MLIKAHQGVGYLTKCFHFDMCMFILYILRFMEDLFGFYVEFFCLPLTVPLSLITFCSNGLRKLANNDWFLHNKNKQIAFENLIFLLLGLRNRFSQLFFNNGSEFPWNFKIFYAKYLCKVYCTEEPTPYRL